MSPLRAEASTAKHHLERSGQRFVGFALKALRRRLPRALHPLTTANAVTLARIFAIVPILYGTLQEQSWAFWLFVAAALSDLLDGWIARHDGPTPWGTFLDQTSDKVTTLPLLALFAVKGYLPTWLLAPAGILFALDLSNLAANIRNFRRGHAKVGRPPDGKRRFSTAAGQIKFWAQCLGIGAFMVAHFVAPEGGFGLRYFGYFAVCIATAFAALSLRDKLA
ncbi:CDP-alcohol phosphatidyltransferase family protein [Candidatus Uhrbacteria bacterium]|nr:CDP-alcohol phosphatidyltransferase family protein [Candidatus Uhrbacteria bacterium]